ncbi:MAG: preprotein translocase subunit SecG, partial [Opitutales bacterium]|nr:preprotein translocase subunit SecG [Opitutales bacterium]
MGSILIYGALTVLAFVSVLVVLFVLMQKPSANAGMGSALGGAASESVFGGEAAGVLSKATVVFFCAFFFMCAGGFFWFIATH